MMAKVSEIQAELEGLLAGMYPRQAKRRAGFGRVDTTNVPRVQVLWAGIDDQRLVYFQVVLVVATLHEMGDDFVRAWDLVRASEKFSPQLPVDAAYGETPPGGTDTVDFASFLVSSNEQVEIASGV